ncbi:MULTISPECIES: OmpH/Skp family outer membrane protein [Pseudothermotoga]|uniref:OmpH family outer membrane protein n=1 Tax=Pseudothermotoga TaxID=1643951 RepID=UPI00074620A3|nr:MULTISPECIES: OmpH family outer membrane protein [Pseudothermotoga]KUK21384.1 MAG: Outer membrane chaperone Skp (OmpH) [Pseudothermotoga lettingae]MDK2884653.1 outer membrane protein [Pseudothermotoga sp.]
MKKVSIIIGAVSLSIFMMFFYGATQESPKIVFVDVNRITQEYPKMVELNERYKADFQYYQNKLNELTKELENMQKSGASQADIEKKQNEILTRKQQYEQLLQNEYQPKMQEALNEIADKIDKYAKMMGYDYIMNKQMLVYGDDAYDITDQLVKFLKAQ